MKFGTALVVSVALMVACDSASKSEPVADVEAASPVEEATPPTETKAAEPAGDEQYSHLV